MNKKLIPILLLLIFIAPVIASFILFHYHEKFPLKQTNYGELVSPPILTNYLHKWQIIYVCDKDCDTVLHSLEQIKKASGKDSDRIQVQLKTLDEMQMIALQNHNIYLIDPRGMLFMFYNDSINPMSVMKDLKKVMGASQIG